MPLTLDDARRCKSNKAATSHGSYHQEALADGVIAQASAAGVHSDSYEAMVRRAAGLYAATAKDFPLAYASAVKAGWALDLLQRPENRGSRQRSAVKHEPPPGVLVGVLFGLVFDKTPATHVLFDRSFQDILDEAPVRSLTRPELLKALYEKEAPLDAPVATRVARSGTGADVTALMHWLPASLTAAYGGNPYNREMLASKAQLLEPACSALLGRLNALVQGQNLRQADDMAIKVLALVEAPKPVRDFPYAHALAVLASRQGSMQLWWWFSHHDCEPGACFGGYSLVQLLLLPEARLVPDKLRWTLARGGSLSQHPPDTQPPLAMALGQSWKLAALLFAEGLPVNEPDGYGDYPLHTAISQECTGAVLPLLSMGADPHAVDAQGRTAHQCAVAQSQGEAARLLERYVVLQILADDIRLFAERHQLHQRRFMESLCVSRAPIDSKNLLARALNLGSHYYDRPARAEAWLTEVLTIAHGFASPAAAHRFFRVLEQYPSLPTSRQALERLSKLQAPQLEPFERLLRGIYSSYKRSYGPTDQTLYDLLGRYLKHCQTQTIVDLQTGTEVYLMLPLGSLSDERFAYMAFTTLYEADVAAARQFVDAAAYMLGQKKAASNAQTFAVTMAPEVNFAKLSFKKRPAVVPIYFDFTHRQILQCVMKVAPFARQHPAFRPLWAEADAMAETDNDKFEIDWRDLVFQGNMPLVELIYYPFPEPGAGLQPALNVRKTESISLSTAVAATDPAEAAVAVALEASATTSANSVTAEPVEIAEPAAPAAVAPNATTGAPSRTAEPAEIAAPAAPATIASRATKSDFAATAALPTTAAEVPLSAFALPRPVTASASSAKPKPKDVAPPLEPQRHRSALSAGQPSAPVRKPFKIGHPTSAPLRNPAPLMNDGALAAEIPTPRRPMNAFRDDRHLAELHGADQMDASVFARLRQAAPLVDYGAIAVEEPEAKGHMDQLTASLYAIDSALLADGTVFMIAGEYAVALRHKGAMLFLELTELIFGAEKLRALLATREGHERYWKMLKVKWSPDRVVRSNYDYAFAEAMFKLVGNLQKLFEKQEYQNRRQGFFDYLNRRLSAKV